MAAAMRPVSVTPYPLPTSVPCGNQRRFQDGQKISSHHHTMDPNVLNCAVVILSVLKPSCERLEGRGIL